jgi:hypothetical protein
MLIHKVTKLQVVAMHAGASAAAWTCGDSVAIAHVEVTARALAKAAANAAASAFGNCAADEGGWMCAEAGSSISVWEGAVARSWASAWAGAYTCKDTCSVEVEVVMEAVTHILVDATVSAYDAVCGDGASPPSHFLLSFHLVSLVASLTASCREQAPLCVRFSGFAEVKALLE